MFWSGYLRKMTTTIGNPIQYFTDSEKHYLLNNIIGKEVVLTHTSNKECIVCGKSIKKTYGQGFCYPCFQNAPENSECIIKPELCEGHLGKGRDPEWEQKHHNQPHVVYVAQTEGVKVGVTRKDQVPTRWIDQGASRARVLAEFPYRQLAGKMEIALKSNWSDRTNWRKMLTNQPPERGFSELYQKIKSEAQNHFNEYLVSENNALELNYPVEIYPKRIRSISFDKTPYIRQKLAGIRGQYLIFESGNVLNIRKFSGYEITIEIG
ncbi:MAG TPA: DUF2797 domain-containing protein [Flavobacteriales bacterium]|nr:DUF2797 domain-containing protein [Flavobacteriales bacterium]